jgi:hypothetical protein
MVKNCAYLALAACFFSFDAFAQQAVLPASSVPVLKIRPAESAPGPVAVATSTCKIKKKGVEHSFDEARLAALTSDPNVQVVLSRGVSKSVPGFKSALLHYEVVPVLAPRNSHIKTLSRSEVAAILNGKGDPKRSAPTQLTVTYHDGELQKRTLANQLKANGFPNLHRSDLTIAMPKASYDEMMAETVRTGGVALGGFDFQTPAVAQNLQPVSIEGKRVTDADYPLRVPVYVLWRDTAEGERAKGQVISDAVRERRLIKPSQ